jgi:holo-[acyl-carrier protein] synthase
VQSALELVAIEEAERVPAGVFSEAEWAYARSKSDPVRRLAARLAAKRAAGALLGAGPEEIEVLPARGGPPQLRLGPGAQQALLRTGARRALVSLTHGRTHAAAAVLLVE